MALWQPNKAIFYMPSEADKVEKVKNKTWITNNASGWVSAIVGSGLYGSGTTSTSYNFANTANDYVNPSGITQSMTCVMWVSGLRNANGTWPFSRAFGAGYGNGTGDTTVQTGLTFGNGVAVPDQTSGFVFNVRSIHSSWSNANPWYFDHNSPWLFVAGHAQWFGTDGVSGWFSINGNPWTFAGTGILPRPDNSWGKATIVTSVESTNPETPRALDEAAFWVDGIKPTDAEVFKMYQMGLRAVALDQFDNWFAPVSGTLPCFLDAIGFQSGTSPLFTVSSGRESGSIGVILQGNAPVSGSWPLVISSAFTVASGFASLTLWGTGGLTTDFTIEDLLRTGDHDPQVLGVLDYQPPGDVFIEVWDITEGTNSLVPVSNSGCYAIGNTGRWGWSTRYLPTWSVRHPLYYYRMSAPNGETFEGQFFMNTPGKTVQHPERREVTIVTH